MAHVVQLTCHLCLALPTTLARPYSWRQMQSRSPRGYVPNVVLVHCGSIQQTSTASFLVQEHPADAAPDQAATDKPNAGTDANPTLAAPANEQQAKQPSCVPGSAAGARISPAELPDAVHHLLRQSVMFMQEQSSVGSESLVRLGWGRCVWCVCAVCLALSFFGAKAL